MQVEARRRAEKNGPGTAVWQHSFQLLPFAFVAGTLASHVFVRR